jgi:autotransporter-associated beta strand protein
MRSASFPARLLDRCIRIGLSTAMFTAGLPAVATPIDFSGSAYTQDFQSMTGGAFNATTISVANMLDVSTLAMSGSAAGVNGWYVYGGNATPRQGISNGSSSTGSFYQLIDGSGGRALGAQGSGNADWFFGVVLKNTSGATINNLTLAYDAVMNRNPASTVNAYPLSWLVSNATVASGSATGAGTFANGAGTWNTTTLGFSTPSSGTGAPGSQAAINPMFTIGSRSGNLTNMTWGADQYLYIRWNEKDEGGADATAGVDNFSLTPLAVNNLSWNVAGSGVWDTTTANWTTGSGATTFANGDQATFSNAAGGTITLSGALAPSTVVVSAASGTYTFSGPGAGDAISGAASLSKSNAGTLALTSVNTYAGGTSLSGGTLEIDGDGRLGSGGVTISGGATLRSTSATDFALANTLGIGSGGGTIDTGASNMSVAGVSSLSGVLTKAGSGSLTVSGAFSPGSGGGVSVAAGNLVLGNGPTASGVYNIGASGVLTGNLVLSGTQRMNVNDGANLSGAGQVQLATSGALLSNVSGNAGGTISAGIGLNSSAAPFTAGSWTGDVYTPGSFLATIGATQGPTGVAGTLTVNGTISGDSDLDLSNSSAAGGGGGVLTLGAQNTYAGNTTINTGSPTIAGNANVVLGIDDAIPVTSGVIVGTKTGLGGAILDMNGFDQQVAYLADGANATVGTTKNLSIVNKGATASTLTLGGLTTPGKAFGGSIGGGTGTIDVVKTGANTQSLAGVNTYTGSTTIDQGTLALTGAGSLASPTIVVASGATFDVTGVSAGYTLGSGQTLGGTGTVTGPATIAGSIAPNMNAIGTFTLGATTLSGGGGLDFQLYDATGSAGSAWDLLSTTADLTVPASGSFTIRLASASSAGGTSGNAINFANSASGSWKMMTTAGSLLGFDANRFSVDASAFTNPLGGGIFSVSDSGLDGTGLYLVFTPGNVATWQGGSGTWSETGGGWSTGTWDPARTAVFNAPAGTVTVDGAVSANNGIQFGVDGYQLTGGTLTLGGASAAANTISIGAGTATIGSTITASSGLTKGGAGTLVVTGDVTASQTTITSGVLQVGSGATTGSLSGPAAIGAGAALVFDRSAATSFAGDVSGAGEVRTDGGDLTLAGSVGDNVAVTNAGTARVVLSGPLTGAATVSNSGAGRIDIVGPTVNTTGAVTVNAGTVGFGDAGLGSGSVALSGGGTLAFDGTAPKTIANAITVAASGAAIDVASDDRLTLGGSLNRTGVLTKTGDGTLSVATLPTSNLSIAAGTLDVSAGGTVTVASDLAPLFAGGKLAFSGANVRVNVNTVQTGTGTIEFTKGGQSIAVSGASGTLSNPVNLALPSGALNLGATSGNTLSVNGPITGTGDVNFAVGGSGGAGTTLLNAASTFSGNVTVNSAASSIHRLGVDNALPTTAGVTFGSTAGAIDLNGRNQQIASLQGGSAAVGGIVNSVTATQSVLSVVGSANGTYSGPIGKGSNSNIAVVKDGTSSLTLSGSSTYTGGTDVKGGTLAAGSVNAFGTGGLIVRSGATLDLGGQAVANSLDNRGGAVTNAGAFAGSQTLSGNSTFTGTMGGTLDVVSGGVVQGDGTTFSGAVTFQSGAVHAPGNSPGVQSFSGGLAYAAGSRLRWDLIANAAALADRGILYDAVNVLSGPLTIDPASSLDLVFNEAGSTVDWSDGFWSVGQSWLLIDASSAGSSTGLFSLGTVGNDSTGSALASIRPSAAFSVIHTGSNLVLAYDVVVVPEPGALSLAAFGCALAAYGALRRRTCRSAGRR